jgi:AraC-like DNA-binding protein
MSRPFTLHGLWYHGKIPATISFFAENIRFLAGYPKEVKYMGAEENILLNPALIPERDPLRKIFQGDFNLSGSHVIRSKRFNSPSALARRSYFYLQNMASINFPANYFTRRSGLDSYLMGLTFSGEGHLEYEEKNYALKSGEGFIIDCTLPHYYKTSSRAGWGYHIVHFSGFAMKDYFSQIRNGGGIKFTFGEKDRMYTLLDRLYDANKEFNKQSEFLTSCILTNMLTEIMKSMSSFDTTEAPEKIKRIRSYIEEHYAEDISLEKLENLFALSMYHLCREFKRYIGQSPNEYLIRTRINNAKSLLLHAGNMNVGDIAREVGFADNSHFFAIFKKYERLSPAKYRKQWGLSL